MKHKILFIIDMQNSFITPKGNLYIKDSNKLIDKANKYLHQFGNSFNNIVLTYDTHFKDTYNNQEESKIFPLHCEYNTQDWKLALDENILNKLTTQIYYLKKDTFNLWNKPLTINNAQTDLYKIIDYKNNEIKFQSIMDFLTDKPIENTEITLFGVASDYCCKYAFDGLLKLGYKVNILQQLTKEINTNIIKIIANNEYIGYNKSNMLNLL